MQNGTNPMAENVPSAPAPVPTYTASNSLPNVENPDDAFANMTRDEYLDYLNNYRGFENQLINKAQTDTSMIDQAYKDSDMAIELNNGIRQRNRSRYGGSLTATQASERDRAIGRASSLGTNNAVNNARIAQKEANQGLMSDLINIGQGVNRASATQMQSAADMHSARNNAYTANKAAHKSSTISTIASLGALAIAL